MNIDNIKNKYDEIMDNWKNWDKVEELKSEMNDLLQDAFDKYGEKEVVKEYNKFTKQRLKEGLVYQNK